MFGRGMKLQISFPIPLPIIPLPFFFPTRLVHHRFARGLPRWNLRAFLFKFWLRFGLAGGGQKKTKKEFDNPINIRDTTIKREEGQFFERSQPSRAETVAGPTGQAIRRPRHAAGRNRCAPPIPATSSHGHRRPDYPA